MQTRPLGPAVSVIGRAAAQMHSLDSERSGGA
jgi:hypothetical protein